MYHSIYNAQTLAMSFFFCLMFSFSFFFHAKTHSLARRVITREDRPNRENMSVVICRQALKEKKTRPRGNKYNSPSSILVHFVFNSGLKFVFLRPSKCDSIIACKFIAIDCTPTT